jgi:hypothetical protein
MPDGGELGYSLGPAQKLGLVTVPRGRKMTFDLDEKSSGRGFVQVEDEGVAEKSCVVSIVRGELFTSTDDYDS